MSCQALPTKAVAVKKNKLLIYKFKYRTTITWAVDDELPSTETVWKRNFLEFFAVAPTTTVSVTLL